MAEINVAALRRQTPVRRVDGVLARLKRDDHFARIPNMSVAGIWITSVLALTVATVATIAVIRWHRSHDPLAVQYRRMRPDLRQPLTYRERGLNDLRAKLLQSDETYGPG